jgi:hypothetical protein
VEVCADIEIYRAAGTKLIEKAREPTLEKSGPRGEQEMWVPSLRDLSAWLGSAGQLVTVDDDHGLEAVGEHTCGAQSGHTRPDHDRCIP